jgi:acyl-coenzyme A thioesterase 13
MNKENKVVAYLKSNLNKPMNESPSAVGVWLQGVLKEVEEGQATIEYTIRRDMTNPAQTLHGGMASTIIDDAIGVAIYSLDLEVFYTSINLTVDFLSSAAIGEIVTVKASIVRKGSRVINAECSIRGAAGNLIARGTSNLISTNKVRQGRR